MLTDIASYLPEGTVSGTVFLASAPAPILFQANTDATNSLREQLFDPTRTLAYDLLLTLGRLMFIRSAEPGENVLPQTIQKHEEGSDFIDENPEVSSETRHAFLGMALAQSPIHRLSTTLRPQEHEKVFKLLQDGLPVLEVYGTTDGYISGDRIVKGLKPITKDLRVEVIEGACHALFVDKPSEVMKHIVAFVQSLS